MHVHHLIAVVAESEDEAASVVESFLEGYEGSVWDWYEIGGRWSGAFGDGRDILCAEGNLERFMEMVDGGIASRLGEIRDLRRYLIGDDGSEDSYDPLGFGAPNTPEAKSYRAQHYLESAMLFAEMLRSDEPDDPRFEMLGWRLRKLGSLLSDYYLFDSMFFDAEAHTGRKDALVERVATSPGTQWLVSVDLHN